MTRSRPLLRLLTSVRTRFALAYAALLGGTGIALLALFYTYIGIAGFVRPGVAPTGTIDSPHPPTIEASAPANPLIANIGFIALVVLVVLLAMWVGWLIAGRLLRPLDAIHRAALSVSQGDMSTRVTPTNPEDEFARLAVVFNGMLDRIQQSIDTHRRFAANASHELRTPLATNKAMLAVAADRPDETDLLQLIARLDAVNQHNIDTVEALLDLADADQAISDSQIVDLAEVVREQLDIVRDEAQSRHLTISEHLEPARVLGSPVLLARLVSNLLRNAVRHNVHGGTILLRTDTLDGLGEVRVENTGAPLTVTEVSTFTEPFVRRQGRTELAQNGGLGLGLAIVSSIARAHHARLMLRARTGGGLVVTFNMEAP
jgi:two-component system sensor histidine kinase VanS